MGSPRLAILCSGQGAQHPAMFDLARGDAQAAALLERCLAPDLLAMQADLFANRHAQPAIVAAACATWVALQKRLPAPTAVAGYSVGEVAALAVAGVLDPADAIALAGMRAGLMDACVDPAQPQGLMAVSGLDLPAVRTVLRQSGADAIEVAIINGADQCILGGRRQDDGAATGLTALAGIFERAGAQVSQLPVAIASHTKWMQAALAPLQGRAAGLPTRAPSSRLLAGVDGQASATAQVALDALCRQTVETVRWDACMDGLAEAGVTLALELGPGSALSRMLAARHPAIACRSVADFRSLDGIAAWVGRQ